MSTLFKSSMYESSKINCSSFFPVWNVYVTSIKGEGAIAHFFPLNARVPEKKIWSKLFYKLKLLQIG